MVEETVWIRKEQIIWYSSLEEMFAKRAEKYKREGNHQWAMAKNGEGDYHYGKAKACYGKATENQAKANKAKATGATWARKSNPT